jgi:hypothetical protein
MVFGFIANLRRERKNRRLPDTRQADPNLLLFLGDT